jgi:N-acetylneuraminic acid mutarotase
MRRSVHVLAGILLSFPLAAHDASARTLTFQERVAAQEAIERVYYSHQIGATVPFQEAVPRPVLEQKVETYLKLTEALRFSWRTDIGSDALRQEMARIASRTRFPDRLAEIDAALGHDGYLMQECLARPVLVDRMARSFFAGDTRLQAGPRREAEALLRTLSRGASPGAARIVEERDAFIVTIGGASAREAARTVPKRSWDTWWAEAAPRLKMRDLESAACAGASVPSIGGGCKSAIEPANESRMVPAPTPPSSPCPDNTWNNGALDDEPPGLENMASVWTGSILFVWGGTNQAMVGARYNPVTDSWQRVSQAGQPSERQGHSIVWAGNRVVVWGGYENLTGSETSTGGRYDPTTDTWTPTSTTGAPSTRFNHSAVSTGATMILWGGLDFDTGETDTGGRYDVASDTWTATSLVNAPEARNDATAVWTGSRMIVWGGFGSSLPVDSGGSYDPVTDTWTATSLAGAPEARYGHTAVWTGSRMIVWGGSDYDGVDFTKLGSGGRYDPAADTWTDTSLAGAPAPRNLHGAVWTGSRMIVWGGRDAGEFSHNDGARYDPATDTWTATSTSGAPQARDAFASAWTGSLMIVWGGASFDGASLANLSTGGRYNPASDSWTPTFTTGAPSARGRHRAVWTGNVMIVWGGYNTLGTGSRYNPITDSWSPTTNVGAPTGRDEGYTMIWSGTRAIVWGGLIWDGSLVDTGGRYDPAADSWTPTSTTGAPSPRTFHSAVWAGNRMIVWGGSDYSGQLNTGGRYDPFSDTWTATATAGAPTARSDHAAIWTGKVMIIWAGYDTDFTNTGGRYNPASDTWQAMTTVNAPEARRDPPSVWSGSEMLTWGGFGSDWFNTGGRYDPKTDTWQPTSLAGAPAPRETHTAVWTGKVMVVWGGRGVTLYGDGGRYNPKTNTWAPVTTTGAPIPRSEHTAVWANTQMIIWGGFGFDDTSRLNDGGRYILCP